MNTRTTDGPTANAKGLQGSHQIGGMPPRTCCSDGRPGHRCHHLFAAKDRWHQIGARFGVSGQRLQQVLGGEVRASQHIAEVSHGLFFYWFDESRFEFDIICSFNFHDCWCKKSYTTCVVLTLDSHACTELISCETRQFLWLQRWNVWGRF